MLRSEKQTKSGAKAASSCYKAASLRPAAR